MISPEPAPLPETPEPSSPEEDAGRYPSVAQGFEHGLVVLAMGLPFWLAETPDGCALRVEAKQAARVRRELAAYDRESATWPPAEPLARATQTRGAWIGAWVWVGAVTAIYQAQLAWPGRLEIWGALDPAGVLTRGEWWRPATALFLHADIGHLIANVAIGAFILAAVAATFGPLVRGWSLLIASALVANLLTAAVHAPSQTQSLGASTAVFAGIGLLTGHAMRRGRHAHPLVRVRATVLPLAAGAVLLGLLGGGGVRVDVVAHAAGFFTGLLAGFVAGNPAVPSVADEAPGKS